MPARIGVGGLWHETNTFARVPTTLEDFHHYQFAEGNDLLHSYRGVRNEIGGFIEGAAIHGFDLAPSIYAAAVPSGIVQRPAYEYLKQRILQDLPKALDGILLALHGAMVAEGVEDVEADLLRSIRNQVGVEIPIVATFDLHGNLSQQTVENADALIGYDTYPHIDMYERALEACQVLRWILEHKRTPVFAFRKLPLLTAPQAQETGQPPMKQIFEKVRRIEQHPGILTVSAAPGFPYSDIPRLGFSVLVYADRDQELADRCAQELAEFVWSVRKQFHIANVPVAEAVARAMAVQGPVVLVDVADNIGGGTRGDGTAILRELITQKARNAVVVLADCQAVTAAVEAGVRQQVGLQAGAEPVRLTGRVRLISDGIYVHRGSYMTGQTTDMGRTAVLDAEGLSVVLTERPTMPFDAEQLYSLGIDPRRQQIIVAKSAIGWKAAYGDVAKDVIYVDTPGICSSNLKSFSFRRVPRPIFPLDEDL